jgi:hypothetical protein
VVLYEYYVFRFRPNIVSGEFKNFGVLLAERPTVEGSQAPRKQYIGALFSRTVLEFAATFDTWDSVASDVIEAFIAEAETKVKEVANCDDLRPLESWLNSLSESSSGFIVEGPLSFSSSEGRPEDVLRTLFGTMVGRM